MISVVMPAYNCESTIELALKSTLSQLSSSDELIVINDGSIDNTRKIIEQTNDSRLKLINNIDNLGVIDSLNNGIDNAKGEFIARMDADDICLPNRFIDQIKFINESKSDIIGSRALTFGAKINTIIGQSLNSNEIDFCLLNRNPIIHPTVLGRSLVFKDLRYNNDCIYAEDYDLWTRCLSSGFKMTTSSHVVIKYRVHKSQISTLKRNEMSCMAAKIKMRHLSSFLSTHGFDDLKTVESLDYRLYFKIYEKINEHYPYLVVRKGVVDRELLYLSLTLSNSAQHLSRYHLLKNGMTGEGFLYRISNILALCYYTTGINFFKAASKRLL